MTVKKSANSSLKMELTRSTWENSYLPYVRRNGRLDWSLPEHGSTTCWITTREEWRGSNTPPYYTKGEE
jgi:hypothetical protein